MNVLVHYLPALVRPEALGGVVVVIDQLRASSTIVAALAAGAKRVAPCLTVEDARAFRERCGGNALLGGERHGKLIEGFDLGNSPFEYTPQRVGGQTIAFTTTNGTRALLHAVRAARILVGCLNNQDAVAAAAVEAANARRCDIHLLCAGTGGAMCADDVLAAGAIADAIADRADATHSDTAMIAAAAFREAARTGIERAMLSALGGQNLVEIGMAADVGECSRQNVRPVAPVFDQDAQEIRLVQGSTHVMPSGR